MDIYIATYIVFTSRIHNNKFVRLMGFRHLSRSYIFSEKHWCCFFIFLYISWCTIFLILTIDGNVILSTNLIFFGVNAFQISHYFFCWPLKTNGKKNCSKLFCKRIKKFFHPFWMFSGSWIVSYIQNCWWVQMEIDDFIDGDALFVCLHNNNNQKWMILLKPIQWNMFFNLNKIVLRKRIT